MRGKKNIIPQLETMNLYASHTTGYGNCLFNALSDQLHGDESKHAEYRADTMQYMRANSARFTSFIAVHPGGGTRRNPKRKNRGAMQGPVDNRNITTEEVNASFEQHLKTMEKGGAYGDNLEIIAFANAYKVNVSVYSEGIGNFLYFTCDNESGEIVKTAYIVHHTWEHYSSIRNKSGPHTGIPNVDFVLPSTEIKATAKADVGVPKMNEPVKDAYSRSWVIDQIQDALPYVATREAINDALVAYNDNFAKAVSALMPTSSESSSRSSSIERDTNIDEDIDQKPKKKADRRSSRPHPLRIGKSNKNFNTDTNGWYSVTPDATQLSAALSKLTGDDPDETEEEDWHNESTLKNSETTSVSTSTSGSSAASKGSSGAAVRIKLSQPKKPGEKVKSTSTAPSEQSHGGEYDADAEKPQPPRVIAKPRRRLITGIERDRLLAEKAKEASGRASLSPTSANAKKASQSPPVIDVGIKVLSL